MIIQEELNAKFDESTDCLIMHKLELSKLQLLSLQAADKFSQVSVLDHQSAPTMGGMPMEHQRRMFAGERRGAAGGPGGERGGDKQPRGGGDGGGMAKAFHRRAAGGAGADRERGARMARWQP